MDLAHHEEHVTLVQLGPVIQFSPLVDELSSSLFTYIYIERERLVIHECCIVFVI